MYAALAAAKAESSRRAGVSHLQTDGIRMEKEKVSVVGVVWYSVVEDGAACGRSERAASVP